ncbi:hypothetical protein AVEN_74885-1 [Araneus ventricosus]|uniref:Uncharacterized protein n=1 Tax=Araneus ventricosus TaxID=182803 RepID=A0A4Y2VRT1_ARAVE|nr:hypothetical protein AVEN_74885-1 [Araneus ventricosus]
MEDLYLFGSVSFPNSSGQVDWSDVPLGSLKTLDILCQVTVSVVSCPCPAECSLHILVRKQLLLVTVLAQLSHSARNTL